MALLDLVLYADARLCSPWVLSVWTCLREKQIPFELRALEAPGEMLGAGPLAAVSSNHKIPLLHHGELWLAESMAILEYLEERFPTPPLLPRDLEDRARDREILSYLRTDFLELRRCLPFESLVGGYPRPPLTDKARSEAATLLRLVTQRLTRPPSHTLADFELAFMLRRLRLDTLDLSPEPRAQGYGDALWSRPSVQSWVRHARPATGTLRVVSDD